MKRCSAANRNQTSTILHFFRCKKFDAGASAVRSKSKVPHVHSPKRKKSIQNAGLCALTRTFHAHENLH